MTERQPYPAITSSDELFDLPKLRYLEIAGRGLQVPLEDGADPVEVAKELMERAGTNRFRIVTIQRFSLRPGPLLPEPFVGPPCGAMDSVEGGIVRCELEAHSDGVDHAGRVMRDGRAGEVHYWRSAPAHTP
ncbi:hypothetical protein [Streptomyces sp. SID161]|uniref:hypothetical protein n=1 Tax=Streptomyces sp. SID161 TaxID=2690251 RepID=UPI001370A8E2|nr:hypothetical protein [Streptomyces sp. SID161]MYW18235.1 hypothetical protein [Streptomyces sp. SID2955]MYW43174.1 hypothetical protein [Streptomyces sp. SID161]